MNKHVSVVFLISFIMGGASYTFGSELGTEIRAIADNLKHNSRVANDYGATQRIVTTRLTPEGDVRRIEEKTLRTQWVADKPGNVLIGVRCTDYEGHTHNSQECVEFTKTAAKKSMKPGKFDSEVKSIRWQELYKNFEFQMVSQEGPYQVLTFRPKTGEIDSQNRMEKILAHMSGKVWVDGNLNVVKAEARLAAPVSFGLGLAAKVNSLTVQYQQQQYQDVWLPAHLNVEFNAKVALVHTERQRIDVTWKDPFRHSEGAWAQVGRQSAVESVDKR